MEYRRDFSKQDSVITAPYSHLSLGDTRQVVLSKDWAMTDAELVCGLIAMLLLSKNIKVDSEFKYSVDAVYAGMFLMCHFV